MSYKILILAGGYSNERQISLITAKSVIKELKKAKKYNLLLIEPDGNFVKKLRYKYAKIYNNEDDFDKPWFVAESCMTVGMIGTVIGFMFMLGSSFQQIDPSNIESMRQVIVDMASGMSTALLTTLCGLLAGLFIKVQIVMQEQDDV